MLAMFLQNAAFAYQALGDDTAEIVAKHLHNIEVPENWQIEGQGLDQTVLKTALAAPDCHHAAKLLSQVADHLVWHNSHSLRQRPNEFRGEYYFTAIIGPDSLITHDQLRFGVYLQNAETVYPSHSHEAEELYLPLSGTALWQKDDAPFEPVNNGTLIHHVSYQPHATTTTEVPMLALWAWLGNLSLETYSYVNP